MRNVSKRSRTELSDLPDNILEHILSFLDTKYAVQTSVLSKRWTNLWTCVPDLDFDSKSFDTLKSFMGFVYQVLTRRRHDCKVGRFRFCCRTQLHEMHTCRVFNYAISHHAHHLIFETCRKKRIDLPSELVTDQQSLKTLHLRIFVLPKSFSLTSLTTLHLESCKITTDGSSSTRWSGECFDFFARFPSLITLCLISCHFRKFEVLKISGSQLLNVTLEPIPEGCKVEISAPNLIFFRCIGSCARDLSLINLPSLQCADIGFDVFGGLDGVDDSYLIYLSGLINLDDEYLVLFQLLESLCNAQFVTLFSSTLQALSTASSILERQISPFSRLKVLKLKLPSSNSQLTIHGKVMTYLLSGTSCVENIIVDFSNSKVSPKLCSCCQESMSFHVPRYE